jgi:hypothetical protein
MNLCEARNNITGIGCHACVAANLLTGVGDCAYCEHPFPGEAVCARAFHSVQVDYTCYRATSDITLGAVPRCAQSDCYYQQCVVNSTVLWYYIAPAVIFTVLAAVVIGWWLWRRSKNRAARDDWVEKERRDAQHAEEQRDVRKREREKKHRALVGEMRAKYLDDSDV